jgi:exonuclease SbcC
MKILKLRLSNLNSLVGEWQIDFTDPAYVDDGIFAITGPTGAGKSTLLDAMCLALYGATPRLGKVTKSENELMSRQTGECFAELTFATGAGTYRCYWYQHRGRRKAGNPLQTQRHELVHAATGKILESKVSSVPEAVAGLTGLDFTRFTRSMLLAQGEFAAFLHASDNDRSAILEQITGTAIYADLSKATYARCKDEGNKLTQLRLELEQVDLLDAEALEGLQHRHAELATAIKKTDAALDVARTSQQWVERLQELNTEADQLAQHEEKLQADTKTFESQRDRLHADAKARPLSADFRELTLQQQRLRITGTELEQTLAAQPAALEQQQKAEHQVSEREKSAAHARKERAAWQPRLKQVRTLDVELQALRQRVQSAEADYTAARRQLQTEQARQSSLSEQISELTTALASSDDWLREHAAEAGLTAEIPLLESQLHQSYRVGEQRAKNRQAQAETEAALRKLAAMPLADNHDQQLRQAEEKLRAADELRQSRQQNAALAARVASLEEERARLQQGTPCPLCGATEHPYADHENGGAPLAQPDAVDEARKAYDEAYAALQQLKLKQAITGTERDSEQRRLDAQLKSHVESEESLSDDYNKLVQQLKTKLASYQAEIPAPEQVDAFVGKLRARAQAWQAKEQSRHTQERELSEARVRLDSLQDVLKQAQGQVQKLAEQQAALTKEVEKQQQTRNTVLPDADTDSFEKQLEQAMTDSEQALETARESWREAERQRERLQHEKSRLEAAQESENATLKRLQSNFDSALERAGFADMTVYQRALLSDSDRAELQAQSEALQARQSEAKAARERHSQALSKARAHQPDDPAKLGEELNRLRAESGELNREQGGLEQTLRQQEDRGREAEAKQAQVKQQLAEFDRWSRLNDLIGSADGKRYRNFAQGLTFEVMIEFANQQLAKMTDRYLLQRDSEAPLQLNVIDDYQAGEVRSTKNLSGGESFIVSLALALGLSQMSSHKVRVDSLFLDEGFGTLDETALDVALDTLGSLQQDGKVIGVISHVAALKERIATQIQVHAGTGGRSSLHGPGIEQLQGTTQ